MRTRYGAWIDGIALHDVDPSIYVTDIQESAPQMNVSTNVRALGDGLHVTRKARESISVTVYFMIREYDTVRRKAVMQDVIRWAKSGEYLSISDRPDQRLRVQVDAMPTITSSLQWTQDLSITFTAYAFPYWESEYASKVNTSTEASMMVEGNADRAPVDATVTTTSANVTIRVDSTVISLVGVSGIVRIMHDDDGILRITQDGAPILSRRTPASSDDLYATPGKINRFSVTGGRAVFSVRGVWM